MESGINKSDNNCPLCKSNLIVKQTEFDVSVLIDLYKNTYKLDIKYLINNQNKIGYFNCKSCSLKYFYPDFGGDDLFYSNLQMEKNYYFDNKFEYEVVKKYFNQSMDVLEIGSGKGAFSKLIEYKTYTGLELNESAVKLAKQEGLNLIHNSIQDFANQYLSKKFDIVCSFQVLEHVFLKDLHSFIESSLKLLKVGGKMIIVVPSDSSFLGKTPNTVLNLPPHHLTRWNDESLINIGKLFNLKIVDIYYEPLKKINYNPYLIQLIRSALFFKVKVVQEINILEKIIGKIVKYTPFRLKEKVVKKNNARGHSVIVIYEKTQ